MSFPRIDASQTSWNIAKYMKENHYTPRLLAERLSLSENTIRSYLSARRTPSIEVLRSMADLFHLESLEELIVWKEE